jgi:hypothetical protein
VHCSCPVSAQFWRRVVVAAAAVGLDYILTFVAIDLQSSMAISLTNSPISLPNSPISLWELSIFLPSSSISLQYPSISSRTSKMQEHSQSQNPLSKDE